MTRKNTFLISALLWLSIFVIDTMTACAAVQDAFPGDTQAPEIRGAADLVVYAGEKPDYLAAVTVTDDTDPAPLLAVDSSAVEIREPGVYTARYFAQDAQGNRAAREITVTVLEKKPGFAELSAIYAAVDAQLNQIVDPGMDTRRQVEAIYAWARSLGCTGYSDKSDPYQAAYQMLTIGAGDSYNHYAVCKLMFDRLGIPNLDVVKVCSRYEDCPHYWSLVSLDNGVSWYHFDATPRSGGGDDFCLVTDDFLDDYSRTHSLSHNRNRDLYPATPEL